jgi:hypothetical protein
MTAALFTFFSLPVFSQANDPQSESRKALSGRYFLQGVREVGAELQLGLDGRFSYAIAYSAVDGSAQGRWEERKGLITLTTDPRPPASFSLLEASKDIPPDAGGADKPAVTLLVVVKTKRLGVPWSDIQVAARFSNGLERTGVTSRRGALGFLEKTEPPWKDVTVTEVQVRSQGRTPIPPATIKVPAGTKTLVVDFEPGPLMPSAFERAELRRKPNSQSLLMTSGGLSDKPWVFERPN